MFFDNGYYLNITTLIQNLQSKYHIGKERAQAKINGTIFFDLLQNIDPTQARQIINDGDNISIKIVGRTSISSFIGKVPNRDRMVINSFNDIIIIFYNNKTKNIIKIFGIQDVWTEHRTCHHIPKEFSSH